MLTYTNLAPGVLRTIALPEFDRAHDGIGLDTAARLGAAMLAPRRVRRPRRRRQSLALLRAIGPAAR